MDQQQLSSDGRAALAAVQKLPPAEQARVVALVSTELAARIADAAPTSTPEKIAQASSAISDGIQAARAHGFREVKAPDGTAAIEVKITRRNGEEVTCLLSEGARGKLYPDLAGYGKNELQGVTLLSHDDFKAVVESLYKAILGQGVVKGVLQTEDAALKQAYQIVTEGVRRDGGLSWVVFELDDEGAVAGRRVNGSVCWDGCGHRSDCALFGAAPAE
jgi:hypothetical protein